MKAAKYILIIVSTLLIACNNNGSSPDKILETELLSLTTDDMKIKYLEQILVEDQKVRGSKGQELMLQYGKDSKEHMEYIKKQWWQDSVNLNKIEKYLEVHGYPDKSFGDKATTTPWMIIHHAQGYETREDNFKTIYKAYLDGNIDDGALSFYLGRMYQFKYGERLRMEGAYKAEDELNKLILDLDLTDKKNEVIEESAISK